MNAASTELRSDAPLAELESIDVRTNEGARRVTASRGEGVMTRAQEKLGRALARAIRSLEFDAKLTDRAPLDAAAVAIAFGGPRVEIRHPRVGERGVLHLVAIVALEPAPTIALPRLRTAEPSSWCCGA